MKPETRVIDNRTLVLGLDHCYREAIKKHECTELHPCAREVASALGVGPVAGPVEGYYTEDPRLTEYFRMLRGLQEVPASRRAAVANLPAYKRLYAVTSSPLFGRSEPGTLFPRGRDAIYFALGRPVSEWTMPKIIERAAALVRDASDLSLVGLAVWTKDPVMITAVRESVVLYADVMCTAAWQPTSPQYVWRVDAELARRAALVVDAFNRLFGPELPQPNLTHADHYWHAAGLNVVDKRCVWIGSADSTGRRRNYHWAVRRAEGGGLVAHDFWSADIWTTQRYRASMARERFGALRP